MKFLYPQFLWALFALAIPIAIHLFNFRRIKRVYFSNVSLLKEVKTKTNSFRKLKHFLILLSRLGFVSFLVFAFAQPFLPSANQKAIKNLSGLVSIYVDNSYSMQSEVGNDKYLDLALSYTSDLIKVFPKDARFQMITNNFENKEQYPVTSEEIEDRLTETSFSNSFRDLNSVFQRQTNLLDRYSQNQKNQIFWFSDFQKSTAGDLNKVKLDTNNQYYIIPIKSERTPNLMIDSVWLENPFIKSLETNQINVRLKSFSQEEYLGLTLKLFIDNKQVSTSTVNLAANATTKANFNFTVQGTGIKPCRISFEDYPVTFDNEYYFVINASPKIDILHLYDQKQNNYIENVYSNESVFQVNSFNINSLDYNRVNNAELIILQETSLIDGELARSLREFVSKGGSLVVIPPAKAGSDFVSLLTALNISGSRAVNPDSLGTGKANELAVMNVQNPFYQGIFEKVPNNMNMPYANAVLQWNNLGNNLLDFKNRRPFLTQFNQQQGKVYLFASPLQSAYSNFAKHAVFVPIMYKIASLSKGRDERLSYTFQDKTLNVKVDAPSKEQVYKLVKGDLQIVPAQRIVDGELTFELPEIALEAGFYSLQTEGKKSAGMIALNYGKAESQMDFYTKDQIKSAFGAAKNVQVYDFTENKNFIQEFKEKNIQINLWKYMLIVALICLLIEIALIRLL